MGDTTGGWTLEQEAAAGAIGGHAGTHRAEGLASGDTLGGTKEAVRENPPPEIPVVVADTEPAEQPPAGQPPAGTSAG